MKHPLSIRHKMSVKIEKMRASAVPSSPWQEVLDIKGDDFVTMICSSDPDRPDTDTPIGMCKVKFLSETNKVAVVQATVMEKSYRKRRFHYETDAVMAMANYLFREFEDLHVVGTVYRKGPDSLGIRLLRELGFEPVPDLENINYSREKLTALGLTRDDWLKIKNAE